MTGNQRIPEVDRRLEAGLRTFREWLSADSRRLRLLRVSRVP